MHTTAHTSPPMLSLSDVSKRYPDGTVALRSVTLTVPRGQFCVVLGPSGSGKSTLLRVVNGLVLPTSGTVTMDGIIVGPRTLSTVRPRVAMIHQQFNLSPRLSVAKNVLAGALPAVSTPAALLGLFPARFRRRACTLIAQVGLDEPHLARRASELSGGQQQRVGIARAFMLDPAVILADEPVASLDPNVSRDVLALLKHASKEREATMMCSLHQVDLAREFADRVIGLHAGQIVFDGSPCDLDEAVLSLIYGKTQSGGSATLASRNVSLRHSNGATVPAVGRHTETSPGLNRPPLTGGDRSWP
jgi:phosphonate transport system ATP-binding protein